MLSLLSLFKAFTIVMGSSDHFTDSVLSISFSKMNESFVESFVHFNGGGATTAHRDCSIGCSQGNSVHFPTGSPGEMKICVFT